MSHESAAERDQAHSPVQSAQEVLRRMSLNSPPSRPENPRQVKRAKVRMALSQRMWLDARARSMQPPAISAQICLELNLACSMAVDGHRAHD